MVVKGGQDGQGCQGGQGQGGQGRRQLKMYKESIKIWREEKIYEGLASRLVLPPSLTSFVSPETLPPPTTAGGHNGQGGI